MKSAAWKKFSWKKRVIKPNRQLFDVHICKKEGFWNEKVTPPFNLLPRGREEFLGLGKMHQGKVLVSMAEYFPLKWPQWQLYRNQMKFVLIFDATWRIFRKTIPVKIPEGKGQKGCAQIGLRVV